MQLLEHFTKLTLHPKNAEELKGLILQLAVQGKLTRKWREENPEVEPASDLLEKIKSEKEHLIKEKKIKKEKYFPKIENDEYPDQLPLTWSLARVGEILLRISNGVSGKQNLDKEGYPVSRIETISKSEVNMDKVGYCSNIPEDKVEYYRLIKGDILLSHINSGYHVGKTAIIPPEIELYHGVNLILLRFSSFVVPKYIDFVFNSLRINGYFIKIAQHAIGQSSINQGKIENIISPLPPLAEQKAIVEVVNQLFAEVEQLEALTKERIQLKADFVTSALNHLTQASEQEVASQWEFLKSQFGTFFTEKANIKKLREAILQLAVQGKLTRALRKENRNTEEAYELIETIQNQVIEENKKQPKWAGFIEETEKFFTIPKTWTWSRLGDICNLKQGYAFKGEFFREEPTPYVLTTPGNFYENGGFRDRESKRKYYGGPINEEFVLKAGELIIPMTEQAAGLLGSPAFVPDDGRIYLHNQRLGKMSFDSKTVIPEYSFTFFNSIYFRNELARTCTGMKVRHTSPDRVLCVPFPLPPYEEQKAIVEKVNGLMALCDQLEQEIETHQTTQEHWMQSCLRGVV